ncbi:hypothetical protein ATCC90586_007343 [Pythium insidiosum]|nr:hypothetical protein ATCC90586_007343 [Pythium insidiosum]
MTAAVEDERWDEWEDDEQGRAKPPASVPADPLDWRWDVDALLAELPGLPPVADDVLLATADDRVDASDRSVLDVAAVARETAVRAAAARRRLAAARGLAMVTQWHALALRQSLAGQRHDEGADHQIADLEEELRALAGDVWADEHATAAATAALRDDQLQEITALLHNALAVCDEDLLPFQQAWESVFAELPAHRLVVSSKWLRAAAELPTSPTDAVGSELAPYLRQLLRVSAAETPLTLQELSEAETFQDTKDIQRDEVVVNGRLLAGAMGYGRVVEELEATLRETLAAALETTTALGDDVQQTLPLVAQRLLHACNRTESGGSSYEILSRVVSNHSMDHVLIRPSSEKAPPLEMHVDVGPFAHHVTRTWCFGVRVVVSATTWYCICDANDPTVELFHVSATYSSRLAIALGLTPFGTPRLFRQDEGVVALEMTGTQQEHEETAQGDGLWSQPQEEDDKHVDFDALM